MGRTRRVILATRHALARWGGPQRAPGVRPAPLADGCSAAACERSARCTGVATQHASWLTAALLSRQTAPTPHRVHAGQVRGVVGADHDCDGSGAQAAGALALPQPPEQVHRLVAADGKDAGTAGQSVVAMVHGREGTMLGSGSGVAICGGGVLTGGPRGVCCEGPKVRASPGGCACRGFSSRALTVFPRTRASRPPCLRRMRGTSRPPGTPLRQVPDPGSGLEYDRPCTAPLLDTTGCHMQPGWCPLHSFLNNVATLARPPRKASMIESPYTTTSRP